MSSGKRLFDLFWAASGLLFLWPVFLLIATLIKLDDAGPVFFRQERVGYKGKPFHIWKFRTMTIDAEQRGKTLTVGHDLRITRVGYWLRKFKLDELPQLLNVWVGDMSFVGPRPEVSRYVRLYTTEQRQILELKPGITDPASIKYRNESILLASSLDPERMYIEEIMPEKLRLNLAYSQQAHIFTDFMIILKTLASLFHNREELP